MQLAGLRPRKRRVPRLPYPTGLRPLHRDQVGLVPGDLGARLRQSRRSARGDPGDPERELLPLPRRPAERPHPADGHLLARRRMRTSTASPATSGSSTGRSIRREYVDPAKMSSCFACHDGSTAPNNCSYCHTPPHEKRGECSTCHNTSSWTRGCREPSLRPDRRATPA